MRKNQTVYYVLQMHQRYSNYNLKKSIWEVFEILNDFIDISDPDCSIPNSQHAFQTAEKMREDGFNLDNSIPKYNSKYGIYEPNCGLENVLVSWGHDEYLYRILKYNEVDLPDEALYIIRFHSLYPHHQENAYEHLLDEYDEENLEYLQTLQHYDLYTKSYKTYDINELKPYYQNLINKYLNGGDLYW